MILGAPAPPPQHPALVKHARLREADVQNRIADRITAFAGSMAFVYLHILLFLGWMLVLERKPWPTLTLVVSLEAIFLATFVMISQNRSDLKRQLIADHQWELVQIEEQENTELLALSRQILELTREVHALTLRTSAPQSDVHAEDAS